MAVMRMRVRGEGEEVAPHQESFLLHPLQVPMKQQVRCLWVWRQ
jgi:hypothetical protein